MKKKILGVVLLGAAVAAAVKYCKGIYDEVGEDYEDDFLDDGDDEDFEDDLDLDEGHEQAAQGASGAVKEEAAPQSDGKVSDSDRAAVTGKEIPIE